MDVTRMLEPSEVPIIMPEPVIVDLRKLKAALAEDSPALVNYMQSAWQALRLLDDRLFPLLEWYYLESGWDQIADPVSWFRNQLSRWPDLYVTDRKIREAHRAMPGPRGKRRGVLGV